MTENKIKFTRWIIVFLIILPYFLSAIGLIEGIKWAYWTSPILKYSLFSLIGLFFLSFQEE